MSKEIKQTDAELALSSIKSQFVNLNRFKLRVEADADLRSLTALHLDINKVISYVTGLRPQLEAYKFSETDPELILVKPNIARDIVIEGQQLAHCVGGYTGRVAKGDTNIFFLRHKNSPDVPWVTVEVKNNGVIKQAYGHSDSIIPKVAHRYLHAWAKKQGYKETYVVPKY